MNINIVIISTFKPFLDEFKIEQINALKSWKRLSCKPKIVIVGDDMGVKEVCESENVVRVPNVQKNENGTPLVGDIFEQGWKHANDDDICVFVNGDIILNDSLGVVLERFVKEYPNHRDLKYLLTSQRFDWYNFREINFDNQDWEEDINKGIEGEYSLPTAGDIFIHRKNTIKIPPSGIAKMSYDSWIIAHANKYFDVTINATSVLKIYHQYGKWYQDKKVCDRFLRTNEMITNQKKFAVLMKKDQLTRTLVTHCKITW